MNTPPENTFSGYLKIISSRWWLFVLLPIVTVVVILVINATSQPEYIAYERLQVIPNDAAQIDLLGKTTTLTTAQQVQAVNDYFYDIVRMPSVAWKTIADLGLKMSAEELIRRIDTLHQTEFITVSARMPSPELAKDVVSVHTENAIQALRQIRVNPTQVTLDFLNEQVATQAQALAQAREALQKFQLEHEISALSQEITAAEDAQRQLAVERDRLSAQAARAEALADIYRQQASANRKEAAALRAESLTAGVAISSTSPITTTAPITVGADAATGQRVAELLALAASQERQAQEQDALAAGHRAAIENYNHVLDERKQQIIYLLGLQDQYDDLVSAVKDAEGSYAYLVDKSNEAQLKAGQIKEVGYLKIISPARQPNAPVPRHLMQILAVGILASLLLALLLAFVLEMIERGLGSAR